jgi:hypothetical protein
MPADAQAQFDGKTPVSGYTLFHGKDGKSYYLKGEGLSDDEVMQRVTKLRGQGDPLTQQTQAATPKTSTKPFFEKPPAGTPFPSTNPIEKAGQRLDTLGKREQHAMQSPTPFSNASAVLAPVRAAEQVVGGKLGGYAGAKIAPHVGVSPETGAVVGGLMGSTGAAVGRGVVETAGDLSLEVPNKVRIPGTNIKINRNIPPPPEPPEEIAYQKTKTITEAQESAQAENVKRTSAATKTREAAFNKEAEDRMAIQRRADEATEARMQAEKDAKNARFRAEQTHAKELADMEKARQTELTAQAKVRQIQEQMDAAEATKDAKTQASLKSQMAQAEKEANAAAAQKERLRTQHGDDLMRRQREQDALDKTTKRAADEESVAKSEARRLPPERPGSSGVRPSASEKYLTQLIKKNIISPSEYATLRQELGADATPMQGESHGRWQSRVLGLVRSGRAARGMRDIPSGPSMSPPPSP